MFVRFATRYSRLLLVPAAVLLIAACSSPGSPAQPPAAEGGAAGETAATEPTAGGTFTIGLATEPVSLDPAKGLYIAERLIDMQLYDTLTRVDSEGVLHPGLATAWESNPEATEFTFTLRDDVTFHDGTVFDAAAVKSYLDRVLTIEGFATAAQIIAGYSGSEVTGPQTLTVRFDTPKPTLLQDLAQPWMGITVPTAVAAVDFGQNPVGTGPFRFVEWVAQDRLVVERNPDYTWGPEFLANSGAPLLDQVVFRFLPEQASRLSALQTNEAQAVEDPPYIEVAPLVESGDYVLQAFTAPGMPSHMMINTEKAPTNDVKVREAIIRAVNQDELVQVAFAGLQEAAHNVLSPTTFSYSDEAANLYSYAPEQAKQLLEEAGWVDSDGDGIREKDGQPLTLVYPASPTYESAYMELLAAYLKEVGFDVQIERLDDAGIFDAASQGNHNIVNMGWTSADPGVLNFVYNSTNMDGGSAFSRFRSEELDQTLTDAAAALTAEERAALYREAQMIIMENALALPIYTYARLMLLAAEVQGWQFDGEGYPWLSQISLAQ
jgi:peptide/nickel transport system substrate-binding protein